MAPLENPDLATRGDYFFCPTPPACKTPFICPKPESAPLMGVLNVFLERRAGFYFDVTTFACF